MLRRQRSQRDPMSFLAGQGEMAGRIRAFDWASHPFGPAESWPQALRSALGICLNSAFPTAIYWGPDLRLLYNDAWSHIPGPRHPAALGQPAHEVWSDIWHVIEPQFIHLIETGEGIFVEDQMLPMRRFGFEEETYWDYSFTPIRGEDGAIMGVFNAGNETTQTVLQRRRNTFLLGLSDMLRSSTATRSGERAALRMLGQHLGVERAGIREHQPGDLPGTLRVAEEWTAPGIAPAGRHIDLADLGPEIGAAVRAGHVVRLDRLDDGTHPAAAETLSRHGVASALAAPWMAEGRLSAILFLHSARPRRWTDDDVATVERVLESVMGWIERERTFAREKVMANEIDHRARNLLAVVASIVRLSRAMDAETLRAKLLEQIAALSVTHSLLAERRWDGITMRELLSQELAPYDKGGTRTVLTGGTLVLPPDLAQPLAMVLHELTTNAAKHGALAAADGRLEVTWVQDAPDGIRLDWAEHLSMPPRPRAANASGGFGSTLLPQVVETQLGGRIVQDLTPGGLRCRITVPFARGTAAPLAVADGDARPSVLIVEDEAILAMDLAEIVRDLGYDVFGVAATVGEAIEALERGTPALALLDSNLSGKSSAGLVEPLGQRGVPILVTTGYGPEAVEDSALADHPRIEKPYSPALLRTMLRRALSGPAAG